jgi:hypothetical protein|tara:strand:- start:381 stop:1628 length:1248 start_codon:yes stop_codon:yes gene_type:complete
MDFNKIYLQNLYIENLDSECETGKLDFIWDRYPDNSFHMNLYADIENVKNDERYIFLINVNFDPHGPFTAQSHTRQGVLKSLCEFSDKDERFKKCIEDVKQKRALICFICYEPSNFYFEPYTKLFVDFCNHMKIQKKSTFFMVPEDYHCDVETNGFDVIFYPGHTPRGLEHYQELDEYVNFYKFYNLNTKNMYRDKHFICTNNGGRIGRTNIYKIVDDNNLYEKGYFSYLHTGDDSFEGLKQNLHFFDDSLSDEYVQKLYDKLPIVLDIERIASGEKYYLQPGFLNSYFNINCESFEQNDEWSYCSEKSFKPLISCQPFILVAGQHHLKTYRKWGYKTFHPFIDESYDDEQDYHKRMKMIENEILRLCSFTKKEIHKWYWNMNDILSHNLKNFRNTLTIDAQKRYQIIEDKWKNI